MSSPRLFLLSDQNFDVKCLLLSLDTCVYKQPREWYDFHSWQINWIFATRREKYKKFTKKNTKKLRELRLRLDISPICFWFSYNLSSN